MCITNRHFRSVVIRGSTWDMKTPRNREIRGIFGIRVVLVFAIAASGCDDFRVCDALDAARQAELPPTLSETGLYENIVTQTLADDILAYEPGFPLWSDGAEKKRFLRLPTGTQIDSRDMDAWQFPEGTRFWKEFVRDGVRVETRVLAKIGPDADDWAAMAYVWNAEGTEALSTPAGLQNALGTTHDVPAAANCMGCHGGTKSRILGFSAIQLATSKGPLNLDEVANRQMLSEPPTKSIVLPGNDTDRAALGYLHGNCSHCHNQRRPERVGARCYDPEHSFDFTLRVGDLSSVQRTATFRTAVDNVISPGDPEESEVFQRISRRDPDWPSMPPLGTEIVDKSGVSTIRAWIHSL